MSENPKGPVDWARHYSAQREAGKQPLLTGRKTAAEETRSVDDTELAKDRRYLRPVRATIISDDPEGVHLAVYSWLPMFDAWATGPGLCGESMQQGPLPDGTVVTCLRCVEWRPRYERMLAPGYRAEDDDPDVLRKRIDGARALHQPGSDWSWKAFGCKHDGAHDRRCRQCGRCFPCPTVRALEGQ